MCNHDRRTTEWITCPKKNSMHITPKIRWYFVYNVMQFFFSHVLHVLSIFRFVFCWYICGPIFDIFTSRSLWIRHLLRTKNVVIVEWQIEQQLILLFFWVLSSFPSISSEHLRFIEIRVYTYPMTIFWLTVIAFLVTRLSALSLSHTFFFHRSFSSYLWSFLAFN